MKPPKLSSHSWRRRETSLNKNLSYQSTHFVDLVDGWLGDAALVCGFYPAFSPFDCTSVSIKLFSSVDVTFSSVSLSSFSAANIIQIHRHVSITIQTNQRKIVKQLSKRASPRLQIRLGFEQTNLIEGSLSTRLFSIARSWILVE